MDLEEGQGNHLIFGQERDQKPATVRRCYSACSLSTTSFKSSFFFLLAPRPGDGAAHPNHHHLGAPGLQDRLHDVPHSNKALASTSHLWHPVSGECFIEQPLSSRYFSAPTPCPAHHPLPKQPKGSALAALLSTHSGPPPGSGTLRVEAGQASFHKR